jgi:NAD(P)-dependent dehydrogenase (short-subunit alcohol dehydrogenase family)
MAMGELDNRVALITGAGKKSGIGFAIARAFAGEGAHVILADLCQDLEGFNQYYRLSRWEELQQLAQEISAAGVQTLAIRVDVTDETSVKAMGKSVEEAFGRLDILVNNAGVAPSPNLIQAMAPLAWKKTFEVNVHGTFLVSRAVIPLMVRSGPGGVILNMSSKAGKIPRAFVGAYCSAKAAVIMMSRVMALELAPQGIRVNALCPGQIETDMERWSWEFEAKALGKNVEQVKAEKIKAIPLGRVGRPEDVAQVALFLASSRSAFMTGQAINVTGGQAVQI